MSENAQWPSDFGPVVVGFDGSTSGEDALALAGGSAASWMYR